MPTDEGGTLPPPPPTSSNPEQPPLTHPLPHTTHTIHPLHQLWALQDKDICDQMILTKQAFKEHMNEHGTHVQSLVHTGCFLTGTPPKNSKYKKVKSRLG